MAPVEKGHHDPVTDFVWVSSKTGTEFATVSTDGRICWWDMRKPNEECADSLILTENITGGTDGKTERVVGGTCIEYMLDAGVLSIFIQFIIFLANEILSWYRTRLYSIS